MMNKAISLSLLLIWLPCAWLAIPNGCQVIEEPICKEIYNYTKFPYHEDQYMAKLEIKHYVLLVKKVKSMNKSWYEKLRFFLCTFYFPVCSSMNKPVRPCQSTCEAARKIAEPILKRFGNQTWPSELACNKFPLYEIDVCIRQSSITNGMIF